MQTQSQLQVCRACLSPNLYLFLPMGDHPPANMFVPADQLEVEQPSFPLNTQVCLDCGLIEIADQIPADFFRHYLYVPSGAVTMHGHFGELARVLQAQAGSDLIVDIGCNDGLLLSFTNGLGCKTLGVDPAANLAEHARARGVNVHVGYFSHALGRELRAIHGPAKAIVTTNTFNHIGDLHEFMAGVSAFLADDGVFIVEVPWAKDLLDKNEFDTVYQEHVSEFSLLSFVKLGGHFDFDVVDVHRLSVHGGSMRVFMKRRSAKCVAAPIVAEMLDEERDGGMLRAQTYDEFRARVEQIRQDLITLLDELKVSGKRVAGYGAPAKGNTLLNYFGIGPSRVEFLVDRNPLKHGLYSPGMKIPIKSTDAIATERPDVLLVLAWNFFDEIKEQQVGFLKDGGTFLVPLPHPVLVN